MVRRAHDSARFGGKNKMSNVSNMRRTRLLSEQGTTGSRLDIHTCEGNADDEGRNAVLGEASAAIKAASFPGRREVISAGKFHNESLKRPVCSPHLSSIKIHVTS